MPHRYLVKDIAFQAGLSTATVDRVLNRRSGVRGQTAARVEAAIRELERQEGLIELLGDADKAEGVRIFIGSENKLFSLSGSSVILSPYKDANEKIIGVLGVIGPTRLNYARIVPVVDYTAQAISAIMARKK